MVFPFNVILAHNIKKNHKSTFIRKKSENYSRSPSHTRNSSSKTYRLWRRVTFEAAMGLRAAIWLQLHTGISVLYRTRSKGFLSIISRSICSSELKLQSKPFYCATLIGNFIIQQHYWNREQQFPVEEKPIITPRQTETTSSAQSSYENTYTNSLRSYTSDAAGYPSTGKLRKITKHAFQYFIVSLVSKINNRECLTSKFTPVIECLCVNNHHQAQ